MSDREMKKLVTRLNNLFDAVYSLTNRAGNPIHVDFQKLPPRTGTDYYKFITRPISLHTIGRTIKRFQYKDAQGFIDDLAQISWNARHYNEPGSEIYENAIVLDKFIRDTAIPKLAGDPKIANGAHLHYPDLGPLGDYGAAAFGDDDAALGSPYGVKDDYDDDENVTTTRYTGSSSKLHTAYKLHDGAVKRGRPPIIDKPYEARIKAILKLLKKARPLDEDENFAAVHFERLPDKSQLDYYELIAHPISLHEIRTRVRSRKYSTVQQFLDDLALMIGNAKTYFGQDQAVLNDLYVYEKEAEAAVEREMQRPDSDFTLGPNAGADKFKIPLDLIAVNGHSYKVGDWVLIRNPNDAHKPICGQIFRLWSTDGVQYTNVCWYIRPEQTCHRADRIFYINEVCKTGEYSDHKAEDIVAPCYVIFLTHYQKGDIPPNLLPDGAEWFICEFRYNANTYAFNRIRTWKACLPDEIRQIDQPIVPINEPRKLIKYDSPIKHLLTPNLPDDAALVKPVDGPNANGPPIIGAVFQKPPYYNDELGQCSTSPNVSPIPEFDDLESGRKAYVFLPVSQLKQHNSGGAFVSSGTRQVGANYSPGQLEDSPAPYDSPAFKDHTSFSTPTPGGLGTISLNKSYAKTDSLLGNNRDSTPSVITHNATNYQTTTSVYSSVLPGGVVSYEEKIAVSDANENLHTVSELLIKSAGNAVWFRAPPAVITERVITPISHSAKYLAWKIRKEQRA
ncbi:Bromodomain-containing protein [Metschnikowia bicuspidata var. bicuspidata NRRL YB-4993]|uniref:Bromodomain-containing protein n=1 Tax=Metschnikowia bicuspidata var. bicuspidata NRRL YB-4993 TaxID=869754 RepID=A0A1A0HBT9_9ASCO|nr:Bromodomain-containing protein [Metschnikowia bicuspidata var. bicuspidata NRRL YB-4993]OBA21342.1 Bromodomain-containing protein [Metschnikowia bicuspidata var. bicuspidata NRRL YB-4993]